MTGAKRFVRFLHDRLYYHVTCAEYGGKADAHYRFFEEKYLVFGAL